MRGFLVSEFHPIYTVVLPLDIPLVLHEWEDVLASEDLPGGLRRFMIRSQKTAVA